VAPIQIPPPGADVEDASARARGRVRARSVARYGVPVALAVVAAATIGLAPATAGTGGSPSLPPLTAEQLLTKVARSDARTLSGTATVSTDLGIPAGLLGGSIPGAGGALAGGEARGGATADPQRKLTELLSGTHTLRVAADGPERERLSVLDGTSEYSLIRNGGQLWAYDSGSNSVYHATRPASAHPERHSAAPGELAATPQDATRQALSRLDPTTSVTVDGTAEVAGRAAYQLLITPKQAGTTIGSIKVAIDAGNGVPLRFTLTPKGSTTAAVDIAYSSVDFAKPAASTFAFSVPKGAEVTEGSSAAPESKNARGKGTAPVAIGKGWTSVAELKSVNGTIPGGTGHDAGKNPGQSLPSMLGRLGHRVHGAFGSGTVLDTRLVTVLITDNGTAYVGAVSEPSLLAAADSTVGK
jgi:outer membrane lipoprotein-sorting protein